VDAQGDLFITDYWNNVVREVSAGVITTVVGDVGQGGGYSGDGGPADQAQLAMDTYTNGTSSLAVDPQGDLFVADAGNGVAREVLATVNNGVGSVTPSSQIITVGWPWSVGDLLYPSEDYLQGIAVDTQGDLYLAGAGDFSEITELPSGASPVYGPVSFSGYYNNPTGLAVDSQGDLFINAIGGIFEVPSDPNSSPAVIVNNYSGNRPHWLAVDGQGDLFFEAGSSVDLAVVGSITISVSAANTTTALTASPGTSVAGQTVTFTAAVTPQAGGAVPTGSIQFEVDGADGGSPMPLSDSGTASLALDSLGLGARTP
jgi:Bacterial Ig-like domain (group 3)